MRDKVLKLCRRLKKCTLNDLVSLTEEKEDIVATALLYLDNEGLIQEKNGTIYYLEKKFKKDHVQAKNINLMLEYRTPEETEIIIKGFCLEIPPRYFRNQDEGRRNLQSLSSSMEN